MHKLFNQQKDDYDLINDARTMHLISKEMNGSTVYMTLSFPDSISDKEFHYGEEPIPSDKFRILHVKYIEINKAYDKPISFEMDFIRDEKQSSDDWMITVLCLLWFPQPPYQIGQLDALSCDG